MRFERLQRHVSVCERSILVNARDWLILIAIALVGLAGGYQLSRAVAGAPPAAVKSGDWLLAAGGEDDRARALQRQLRGFDLAMWEVGARFGFLHDALQRQNYEMALYQWDKIDASIRNALVRRPGKAAHAQQFFQGTTFDEIRTEFASGDAPRAWAAFGRAKVACQSCHGVEGVAYVNAHPIFELDAAPAPVAREAR